VDFIKGGKRKGTFSKGETFFSFLCKGRPGWIFPLFYKEKLGEIFPLPLCWFPNIKASSVS